MPNNIDYLSDNAEQVYKYVSGIWQGIVSSENQRSSQNIKDYMGYVNPALYSPNEHHIPTMKLMRQVNLKTARDYMAMVAKYPYLSIEAVDDREQNIADAVTMLIQKMLEQANYKLHMYMALLLASNDGISYIFPYWKVKQIKEGVSINFDKEKWDVSKKTIVDEYYHQGLGMKVYPSYLACFDPSAGYDEDSASWCMTRDYVTLNQAREMLKTRQLKNRMSELKEGDTDDVGHALAAMFNRTDNTQGFISIDNIQMDNRWIRVINKTIVETDKKYNPWTPGRKNLISFKNEIPPDVAMHGGLSDNHMVGQANFMHNLALNTKINAMRQALNKIILYNPRYVGKEDLIAGAGNQRISTPDLENTINVVQTPTLPQETIELPGEIEQLADDIIGIQKYDMGAPPSPMPQSTVFQGMQQGPSARLAQRYDRMEIQIAKFGLHCCIITDQYVDYTLAYEMIGEQARDMIINIEDPINMMLVDPRRMAGGYSFGLEASQKANEHGKQLAAIEKWWNLMANDPGLPSESRAAAATIYTNLALIDVPKHLRNKITDGMLAQAKQSEMSPQLPPEAQSSQPNSPKSGAAQPRLGHKTAMPGMRIGEQI